jgi:biotin transport system substrate-specific component
MDADGACGGNAVIYIFGVLQLSLVANLTVMKALLVGVVPFIIGDVIKILAADWISLKLRKHIRI